MDGFRLICTVLMATTYADFTLADREYMTGTPKSIVLSLNFDTTLKCVMNIPPDKFQWKFYPLKDASNPKADISLTNSRFKLLSSDTYETLLQKNTSLLKVEANASDVAGDYQCLAHYGASIVATIPWRITIATLKKFSQQQKLETDVLSGNTISWRCDPPVMNPEPYVDYLKNGKYLRSVVSVPSKSLIIPYATPDYSGDYSCSSTNTEGEVISDVLLKLRVTPNAPLEGPRFLIRPKSVYNVTKGNSVFLECSAVGNPIPKVFWNKRNGIITKDRSDMIKGGLQINNVEASDDGVYECIHKNSQNAISHVITLNYNEPSRIDCPLETTDVTQGQNFDVECMVFGIPTPEISWFLNGFVVNDSKIDTDSNKIYFRPAEKRHAGNLQIFARNVLETVSSSISIKVIPLSTTQDASTDRPLPPTRTNHKNSKKTPKPPAKIYPPSKPNVTRISDESVMLRWSVQMKGLPIQFFKVQYRELGPANLHEHHNRRGSKWMTNSADIEASSRHVEVGNLKPDHWYRFRLAAVYSNNDNKNSPNSDKFYLRKMDFDKRNQRPTPLITKTETINATAIKLYWKCDVPPDVSVNGYYVNYISASSAGDYSKAIADGPNATSIVLGHLQPDTVYDIKLQSFNDDGASESSSIMKARTLGLATTTVTSTRESATVSGATETAGVSKLYIIVAVALVGTCGLISSAVGLLLFCRKSKQKNSSRNGDKPGVDDHHIQAEANEYVVGPKGPPRANGVASNRITITANPLADADNKNPNMIEMSCLSSQNNNCSVQPSVSGEESSAERKTREKRIRPKRDSGENFV